jgi:hypothetical protein
MDGSGTVAPARLYAVEGPPVVDIPLLGTWARLTHAGVAAGSWHHIREFDTESGALWFDCPEPDISWAIDGTASWAVEHSPGRPTSGLCRACGFRTAFVVPVVPAPVAVR